MELLDIYSLNDLDLHHSVDEIIKTNELSGPFGLLLTPWDAANLIKARNLAVQSYGRIELNIDAVRMIIAKFCSSPYINQHDYVSTLNELIDIFYFMKHETEDIIGDSKLIDLMKYYFDHSCCGSTDLLKNRELSFTAQILKKSREYGKGEDR
jgi:hypothetical protein